MIQQILEIIIPIAQAAEAAHAESTGPVGLFGLDLKLFIAQLVNFLIVLFVLWRWVFGPLGKKLSERTERIEKSLKAAEEAKAEVMQAETSREEALVKARNEAAEIISKAQKTAEVTKEQILADARVAGEKLVSQAGDEIKSQKEKAMVEIRQEAASLITLATEKILRAKLDPVKDKELIKKSLDEVK